MMIGHCYAVGPEVAGFYAGTDPVYDDPVSSVQRISESYIDPDTSFLLDSVFLHSFHWEQVYLAVRFQHFRQDVVW